MQAEAPKNEQARPPAVKPAAAVEVIPPSAAGMEVGEWFGRLVQAVENSASAALASAVSDLRPGEQARPGEFELVLFNPGRETFVRGRLGELQRLTEEITGSKSEIRLRVESPEIDQPEEESQPDEGGGSAGYAAAMNHPLVRRAIDLFEGRVVDVTPPSSTRHKETD